MASEQAHISCLGHPPADGITIPVKKEHVMKGALSGNDVILPDVDKKYNGVPDALSFRRKFGVVIPSTNTIVEYDYWKMIFSNVHLKGIGFHTANIHIRMQDLSTDEKFNEFLVLLRTEILHAVERVITAEPEYLIMGMSAETFYGGMKGNLEFKSHIEKHSGLKVATGAEACQRALQKFGVTKIGIVTPYQPTGDENVIKFFNEIGFEVGVIKGLKCPSAIAIAHVQPDELRAAIREVNIEGVQAIVQAGTNLSMVEVADEMEYELGKPIIAINAATLWFALRENGFTEKLYGCTSSPIRP